MCVFHVLPLTLLEMIVNVAGAYADFACENLGLGEQQVSFNSPLLLYVILILLYFRSRTFLSKKL